MDTIKAFLVILATLICIFCLLFVQNAAAPVAFVFLSIISIYLGLDIANMIQSTANMKKGEYKEIKMHKYIICILCLLACIVVCAYVQNPILNTALSTFISAVLVVIGCLIGGLEGNKIATNKGE